MTSLTRISETILIAACITVLAQHASAVDLGRTHIASGLTIPSINGSVRIGVAPADPIPKGYKTRS